MTDATTHGLIRAAAAVIITVAAFVLAEVWYRRRYNARMKNMKSTANARRGTC